MTTGKTIQAISATIVKHDIPLICRLKDRTLTLNYKVEIKFTGQSLSKNCQTLKEAEEFIANNSSVYSPSYEEVTSNGKFSCD